MKREIPTLAPFTKSIPPGCLRGEKNFGELGPSATTHPQMEAPSSCGGVRWGHPRLEGAKSRKTSPVLSTGDFSGQSNFIQTINPLIRSFKFLFNFPLAKSFPPPLQLRQHQSGYHLLIILELCPLLGFSKTPNPHPFFHPFSLPLQLFKTPKILKN